MKTTYFHSDVNNLRSRLSHRGFELYHQSDFNDIYGRGQLQLAVYAPEGEIYETIEVSFSEKPRAGLLAALSFPDIQATSEEILLEALEGLKAHVDAGRYPTTGICSAVTEHLDFIGNDEYLRAMPILRVEMQRWPEGTGNTVYPIPSPDPEIPDLAAYHETLVMKTLWDKTTEYGRGRHRLLDYLLDRLREACDAVRD